MTKEQFHKELTEIEIRINAIEQQYKGERMPDPIATGLAVLYETKHEVILRAIDLGFVERESA